MGRFEVIATALGPADYARRVEARAEHHANVLKRLPTNELVEQNLFVEDIADGDRFTPTIFVRGARVTINEAPITLMGECNGVSIEQSPLRVRRANGTQCCRRSRLEPGVREIWVMPLRFAEGSAFRFWAHNVLEGRDIQEAAWFGMAIDEDVHAITNMQYDSVIATQRLGVGE